MSPLELIAFVVVFVLGWLTGVFTGTRITHHRLTREVKVQLREVKAWLDRWLMVFVGLVMIVAAFSAYQSQRAVNGDQAALQDQSDCVTQYANRLYESLAPRQHATQRLQGADQRFNDALVRLLNDALVIHPDPSRNKQDATALKRAAQTKQRIAAELKKERGRKPYPPPPKEVCPK